MGFEPARLAGLWGFPLTPFVRDGIDLDALAVGVEVQVTAGVDVICACGSIAQLESLSHSEWSRCTTLVVSSVAGRAPVVATVACDGRSVAHSEEAMALGATAILLHPRATTTVDEVATVVRKISVDVPEARILVYAREGVSLEASLLERLADVPSVIGVKDGQRNADRFRRAIAAHAERFIWVAAFEELALPWWAMGADAFCPVSIAYAPAYTRAWWTPLHRGDAATARAVLAVHAYDLADLRRSRPNIGVSAVKELMNLRGIAGAENRPPAVPLQAQEKERLRGLCEDLERFEEALVT